MKVMIALDDSIYSKHYLKELAKRTWPKNTNFKLISVLEPLNLSETEKHQNLKDKINEQRHEHAQQFLHTMKDELDSVPGSIVHFEIREGNADEQIIESCIDWKPDRLFIGAYGKGQASSRLGKTALGVVSNSPCSVEVMRNKELLPTL